MASDDERQKENWSMTSQTIAKKIVFWTEPPSGPVSLIRIRFGDLEIRTIH
jgi:hypothetical protein